jgi:hypothetical protein
MFVVSIIREWLSPRPQSKVYLWQRNSTRRIQNLRTGTGELKRSPSQRPQRQACNWSVTSRIGSKDRLTCKKARMAPGTPRLNLALARTGTAFWWMASGGTIRTAHCANRIHSAARTRFVKLHSKAIYAGRRNQGEGSVRPLSRSDRPEWDSRRACFWEDEEKKRRGNL